MLVDYTQPSATEGCPVLERAADNLCFLRNFKSMIERKSNCCEQLSLVYDSEAYEHT